MNKNKNRTVHYRNCILYLQSQHCSNVFRKGFVLIIYLQAGFVLLPPVFSSLARQRWVICDASVRVERCCRPMAHLRTAAISSLFVALHCPPLKKQTNSLLEALLFHIQSSVCYPLFSFRRVDWLHFAFTRPTSFIAGCESSEERAA